jgi:translocation and assembly module TamB
VPLDDLLALARSDLPASGLVALDASLEGTVGAPALRATATLDAGAYEDLDALRLEVSAADAGERLRVTARVAHEGRQVATADAEVPLVLADLLAVPEETARGLRRARLEGSVAVTALELASVSGRVGIPPGLAGVVDGAAEVTGTLAAPRARIAVDVARGAAAGYAPLGARLDLTLADAAVAGAGRIAIAGDEAIRFEVSLGAPVERLFAPGALRSAPLGAEVVVPGLALARASRQDLPLTGSLAGRLTAAGTLRAPEVTLALEGDGVMVSGRPLGQARVDARYGGGRGVAEILVRPQAGGTLRASATLDADLGLGAAGPPLGDAPAELSATAEALDLGVLAALLPTVVRSAAGKLALDVRARGPLARMTPRGSVRVEDARVAISEYGEFTGIVLDASMDEDAVELRRAVVRRGRGNVTASGALRGLRSERARLEGRVAADAFTVMRAGMDLATIEARVDVSGGYADRVLAVDLTIPRGVVTLPRRPPRTLQTLERRGDIVVGEREQRRRARAEEPSGEGAAPARPFTLAAHVVVPRNLFVRSDEPRIDLELKADVRYERVGAEDYAEGIVEVVRGSVEPIGGRTFLVERGRVQFTGGPPSAAMLDVQARYDNPMAVVTVSVQGPTSSPEIQLSSQPPMDDAQIAMLIATGRTELKAGSGGVGTLTGEEAGRAALGVLATQAFRDLVADKLPLDTVALDSGALRAGKYVTDKIYVGYTRRFDAEPSRGENVDEVRGEYQISPRWTFESRYGNALSGGASLIWSKDY